MKKILVPVAFSPYTEGIINYAAELAEPFQAELLIVNVINSRDLSAIDKVSSYGFKVDSAHYLEMLKKERLEQLHPILEKLKLPDEKVNYTFCVGDPTTEIIQLILDREIDTVVMGLKTQDIRHIFTGSIAEQMFRKCPVTLVSVRENKLQERLSKKFLRHKKRHQ